ncbi:helix-turn-helix domain-containing protein [Actinomadura sp. NPDC049753]|uniref:nSTAND1 domain-containing NTPase n=1 Tax=Actinomadura sp. NPDC049753 TaxID=3154739 RepID=UPI003449C98A
MTTEPRPDRAPQNRTEFAEALSLLRERAGLTIRDVSCATAIPVATLGGYFSGRHLPNQQNLRAILTVCGATSPEPWTDALAALRRAPGPRAANAEAPYPGLAAFQPADARWYHGRERLTGDLLGRVLGLAAAGGGTLAVVGPSGSGKSSLLGAGLVAALSSDRRLPPVQMTPGRDPIAALRALCLNAPCCLVVDQFEEVFTQCEDEAGRHAFVAALTGDGVPAGSVVVVALRADFYGEALACPPLAEVLRAGQLLITPMDETEVRGAVLGPAREAALDVENGLVELVLRDLAPAERGTAAAHDPGALPLLSHALRTTWEHGNRKRLTVADYTAGGGIHGAIAKSAEAVYETFDGPEGELVKALFLQLVRISGPGAATRRRIPSADVDGLADVAAPFVAARLLTRDRDGLEITHEALIRCWPRLSKWIELDRDRLLFGQRLAEAAQEWERHPGEDALLYQGLRLAEARAWVEGAAPGTVPSRMREFVVAGARRERVRIRRLYRLVAFLSVLVLVTAVTSLVALRATGTVSRQRDNALSAKVANEAASLRAADPALAAQLSLAAFRLAPTAEARGSLLSGYAAPYAVQMSGHTGAVYQIQYSPDGRTLASASLDGTVRLWNVADPHHPAPLTVLTGHSTAVTAAVFSPDGRTLATTGDDRTVRLWDVADPARPAPLVTLSGHSDGIRALAFAADGRTLASGGYDRTVRLWNVADPARAKPLAVLSGAGAGVSALAFSPDARVLVAGAYEPDAHVWDVSTPGRPRRLPDLKGNSDRILSVAFSPDGGVLSASGFDGLVHLWAVSGTRFERTASPQGHTNGVSGASFAGRTLATGSYDHSIRLWDTTDPRRPSAPVVMEGPSDTVYSLDFSPDGLTLASAGADDTIRLWDLRRPILGGNNGEVDSLAFSPDRRLLAIGSYQAFRLWDVTDPRVPRAVASVGGLGDHVQSAAFSPDSRRVAAGNLDGTVGVYDVAAPARPRLVVTLRPDHGNVFAVAFSPDGRHLAVAGEEPDVTVWASDAPQSPPAVLRGHASAVQALAYSPNGRLLATAGADHTVQLWDTRGLSRTATLKGHANGVNAVAFSPDGQLLASGAADRTTILWDVTDAHRPHEVHRLTTGSDAVSSVAFSPDGRLLATAGSDGATALWTLGAEPVQSALLTGHHGTVYAVTFSPGMPYLATGGADYTARLWTTDTAAASLCPLGPPRIADVTWRSHFPGIAYRPPCRS